MATVVANKKRMATTMRVQSQTVCVTLALAVIFGLAISSWGAERTTSNTKSKAPASDLSQPAPHRSVSAASNPTPVKTGTGNASNSEPFPRPKDAPLAEDLYRQTEEDVQRKSWGCVTCHEGV